ncbi:MAG: hypothetical protein S4CHLAM2_18540 [Chlamydiales bacterium]|nr:hypothetical protein [Chlamydiales bacterium]
MAATLITVGALGGAGILSATQVGWGIVGTVLVSIPLRCGICRYHSQAHAQRIRRLAILRATTHDESSSSSSTSSTSGSCRDDQSEEIITGAAHVQDDAVDGEREVAQARQGSLPSSRHPESYKADLTAEMATTLDGSLGSGQSFEERTRALNAQIKAQKAKVREADRAAAKARLDSALVEQEAQLRALRSERDAGLASFQAIEQQREAELARATAALRAEHEARMDEVRAEAKSLGFEGLVPTSDS